MTVLEIPWRASRTAAPFVLVALFAPLAARLLHAQAPVRARTLSGIAYTITVTGSPGVGSGMMAAAADPAKNYTGTAVFAAGRGRLDITRGGVYPLFGKGDYVLFDSTDLLVVHPTAREFVVIRPDAAPRMDQLQSMGVRIRLTEPRVTLDSIGGSDTIAGYPTRRFRMTVLYNLSVEVGGFVQRLASEAVTDYWVAAVPGLPRNSFLRANGFATAPVITGVFNPLSLRVDSVAALMGSRVALRTMTSSRLTQGTGSTLEMRQTSDVADLHPIDVNENFLLLPAGYTQGAVPGAEEPARRGDGGAKWRVLPRDRPR